MKRKDGETTPHGDAVMTFEEIGREMGLTRGGAWILYKRAIKKLRRKKFALRELVKLAQSKDVVS